MEYFIFDTAMGWVGALTSETGLVATTLPRESADAAYYQLGSLVKHATLTSDSFSGLAKRLGDYFSGKRVHFSDALDLSRITAFQARVYEATSTIPYGETRSYGWVAERIDNPRAARAVGQALGRNPWPIIIPCHRILAGDGQLGGFTGGLETKKRLLEMESGSPRFRQ
jgi:methylated-DNA-[protein]-cysteine S-methyltransferase